MVQLQPVIGFHRIPAVSLSKTNGQRMDSHALNKKPL